MSDRDAHPSSASARPVRPRPLDRVALAALREAAALVHVAPALRVRLRSGSRVLATVAAASPLDERPDRWLSPCAFRAAVADAWGLARRGRPVGLSGALGDRGPAIDVGVPAGGSTHPLGVHRWPSADGRRWSWAVATTGGPAPLVAACESRADDPVSPRLDEVRLRVDPALGCVVLRATTAAEPALIEPVAELLAGLVVDQAVDRLLRCD